MSVVNAPGMFGKEVADVALGYVIGLSRHTFDVHTEVLAGGWPKPAKRFIGRQDRGCHRVWLHWPGAGEAS